MIRSRAREGDFTKKRAGNGVVPLESSFEVKQTRIRIQKSRTGDAGFVTSGFDSSETCLGSRAPFVTSLPHAVRGQPEVRQSRARYHDTTGPSGVCSDIVCATVGP